MEPGLVPDVVVWEADGLVDGRVGYGRVIAGRLSASGYNVTTVPLPQRRPSEAELAATAHVLSGGSTAAGADVGWLVDTRRHLAPVLERAIDGSASVTGICFGSQLIATMLAGRGAVGPHPDGMQAGLVDLDPAADGPSVAVSSFHYHWIVPTAIEAAGARIVLRSDRTGVQAFEAGRAVRGTQFHPELTPRWLAATLRRHRSVIAATGGCARRSAASIRSGRIRWSDDGWHHFVEAPIAAAVDGRRRLVPGTIGAPGVGPRGSDVRVVFSSARSFV